MEINNFRGGLPDNSAKKEALLLTTTQAEAFARMSVVQEYMNSEANGFVAMHFHAASHQCCRFSRNIGIYVFSYSKRVFSGSKYPKINWWNFEINFAALASHVLECFLKVTRAAQLQPSMRVILLESCQSSNECNHMNLNEFVECWNCARAHVIHPHIPAWGILPWCVLVSHHQKHQVILSHSIYWIVCTMNDVGHIRVRQLRSLQPGVPERCFWDTLIL